MLPRAEEVIALKADELQGILFPVGGSRQIDALEAWQIATDGKSPQGYQNPGPSPSSVSIANGELNGFKLAVRSMLGRIELNISPLQSEDTAKPPLIENLRAGFDALLVPTFRLLDKTKVTRTALVCSLMEFLNSDAEVSAKLTEATGGTWFPNPPLDAVYQFNVRRTFRHAPHQMNRIVTWSAGFIQRINFSALSGNLVSAPSLEILPLMTFKVDVNSLTTVDVSDVAKGMLEELREEMFAIIENGIERFSNGQ